MGATALRDPSVVMDARRLGAIPSHRLSAARSFLARMIRERWEITLERMDVDRDGNGECIYRIAAGDDVFSFAGFLTEPRMVNRTSRIIGSSWDMVGAIMEGEIDDARLEQTREELPKLYAGRAAPGTLIWFRSNQSLRLFDDVRRALAAGEQPTADALREVGYLMRNTGLDGNGTFGTKTFLAYGPNHPLSRPYHAQMLAAYLMRELAADLVEHLAALDSPDAVRLEPQLRRELGIGNGSALGLVLFFLNRPKLVGSWIRIYETAAATALDLDVEPNDPRFELLDGFLERAIDYRNRDLQPYSAFPRGPEIALDLRRVRSVLRAVATRHAQAPHDHPRPLREVDDHIATRVLPEAWETFRALLLELVPDTCDRLLDELTVDETERVDPRRTVGELMRSIETDFAWVLDFPLGTETDRTRRWYKSRASEEPRSGPADEVPDDSFELSIDVLGETHDLVDVLRERDADEFIGDLLLDHPQLESIVARLQTLRDEPYAIPRVDVRDEECVPAYLIHVLNAHCFGLDRTLDHLNRGLRGLIFANAPYRDELATADPDTWWWSTPPDLIRYSA